MKRKCLAYIASSLLTFVFAIGCGANGLDSDSAQTTEKTENIMNEIPSDTVGQEALELIYSYKNGDIEATDCMTQLIIMSKQTQNEELGKAIEQAGKDIGAESFAGTAKSDRSIEELEILLGVKSEKSETSNSLDVAEEVNHWLSDEYNHVVSLVNMVSPQKANEYDPEYEIAMFIELYKDRDEMIKKMDTISEEYGAMKISFNKAISEIDNFYDMFQDDVYVKKIVASKGSGESIVEARPLFNYVTDFSGEYIKMLHQ